MAWRKLTQQQRAEMGRTYQHGATLRDLGQAFGVSADTARSYLIDMGLITPRGERAMAPPVYRCPKCLGRSTAPIHADCPWRHRV